MDAPPSLSIPPWFPPYLEKTALLMYRQAVQLGTCGFPGGDRYGDGAVAIVERMITDPKMESVWVELTKRNRYPKKQRDGSPKKFVHQPFVPQWLLDALPNADERDQRIAMRAFFEFIVKGAVGTRPIPFREPGAFNQGRHQNEAASLRANAGKLRKCLTEAMALVFSDVADVRLAWGQPVGNLVSGITALDRLADSTEPDWEKRNERMVKAFVAGVGIQAKMLFDEVLYGTVATIATVAFEREIARHRVREIFRSSLVAGWKRLPVLDEEDL